MTRRFLLIGTLSLMSLAPLASRAADWVEGRHYFRIQSPRATSTPPGIVEVMEVFSYACPACNAFVPVADKLKASLPANAKLVYLPAAFNLAEDWPVFQRGYLAAQALGVADQVHDAMFAAVWKTGELAVMDPRTQRPRASMPKIEDVAKWYSKKTGIDVDKFLSTAKSFTVDVRIKAADDLIRVDQVDRTPTIIVAGKYRLHGESAGDYNQLIELVKYLIAKESGGGK